MKKYFYYFILVIAACSFIVLKKNYIFYNETNVTTFSSYEKMSDYHEKIQPLFNNRCVACHSCYNSPCQLNLASYEGLSRGYHPEKMVYDSKRKQSAKPSRLFIDEKTTADWRKVGFLDILDRNNPDNSLIAKVLEQKKYSDKELTPPELAHSCYSEKSNKKFFGMPYGLAKLEANEENDILDWLKKGALPPNENELRVLSKPSSENIKSITEWESYLNRTSIKEKIISRFIYEHLYLGRIYFGTQTPSEFMEFYRLVRSRTPCRTNNEVQIDEIARVRPYDDPGGKFYYCFKKSIEARVHKTHMPFLLNSEKMKRYIELFESGSYGNWNADRLPSYDIKQASNPFVTFEKIPVLARYQFLLDESKYIFMNFILGPVCKGNTALNVINEQFFVMFVDPKAYNPEKLNEFYSQNKHLLNMPAQKGSDFGISPDVKIIKQNFVTKTLPDVVRGADEGAEEVFTFMSGTKTFTEAIGLLNSKTGPKSGLMADRIKYRKNKALFYKENFPNGYSVNDIWDGSGINKNALLTVFRHFESATVLHGALGPVPKTFWLIDYGSIESIYYNLVAGFDVYGDVGHQLATRYYMNQLRLDAEENYLWLLPKEYRVTMRDYWYRLSPEFRNLKSLFTKTFSVENFIKNWYPAEILSPGDGILDKNEVPGAARDLAKSLENLRTGVFNKIYQQKFKGIFGAYKEYPDSISNFGFVGRNSKGSPYTQFFPDMSLVRIRESDDPSLEKDQVFSLIRDKEHYNVAYIFFEDTQRKNDEDKLYPIADYVGSYPMEFFDLRRDQIASFRSDLLKIKSKADYQNFLKRYAVDRNSSSFWNYYDFINKKYFQISPIDAGIMDLNRFGYYYKDKQ